MGCFLLTPCHTQYFDLQPDSYISENHIGTLRQEAQKSVPPFSGNTLHYSQPSLQCEGRTCTQILTERRIPYERALQILAQEEYLQGANLILRKRETPNQRSKRSPQEFVLPSLSMMSEDENMVPIATTVIQTILFFASLANTVLPKLSSTNSATGLSNILQAPSASSFGQATPLSPIGSGSSGIVQPPPGPVPSNVPQPGTLSGGDLPLPDTPDAADAMNLLPTEPGVAIFKSRGDIGIVQPPPGQVPANLPQPGTLFGGYLPLPDTPDAADALNLLPTEAGVAPVAIFKSRGYSGGICLTFSESDETSIANFDNRPLG